MDSITQQYHAAMEWAGENRDWVEIVRDPSRAREVIHEGKLAIVLSIEASDIFGLSRREDSYFYEVEELVRDHAAANTVPSETEIRAEIANGIRRWLDELEYVSTFQISHQLDNAFSSAGYIKRAVTGFSQGRLGRNGQCRWRPPRNNSDRGSRPGESSWRHALEYASCLEQAAHRVRGMCSTIWRRPWRRAWSDEGRSDGLRANPYGLSMMGEILVDVMVERKMPIDAVHMSDIAQAQLIEYLNSKVQTADYPVYVSHTYPTESNALRREQNLDKFLYEGLQQHGAIVGIRPGDDEHIAIPGLGEISEQGAHASCQGTSIGTRMHLAALGDLTATFGSDLNGYINQTRPSGHIRPERTLSQPIPQDCGAFIRDIGSEVRTRGLAHIGLLPALFLEMLLSAEGQEQQRIAQLANGAEAYLQLWERATNPATTAEDTAQATSEGNVETTSAEHRSVNIARLESMLFDGNSQLRTWETDPQIPAMTMLDADESGTWFSLQAHETEGSGSGYALPMLRAIESTLPYPRTEWYGEEGNRNSESGNLMFWDSYPQLPTTIGLLIGTQSFSRHPVGAQFPVSFCRQNRIDDRDSASWQACEQLRRVRNLHRLPWWRTSMSPPGLFSGWRREFPNQRRFGQNIDLHLDVMLGAVVPAQMGYASETYTWLSTLTYEKRRRLLRNPFFENAPTPVRRTEQDNADGSSDVTADPATVRESTTEPAEQYINDIFSRIVSVRRYRDNDGAASRCEYRMDRGSAGCQAFFGIRHYCKLLKQLDSSNPLDYCEPYIRDLPRRSEQ
jgi:hypothetical protein